MMSLRFLAALAALALQLCGCVTSADKSASIQELERRHDATVTNLGGGGGGM